MIIRSMTFAAALGLAACATVAPTPPLATPEAVRAAALAALLTRTAEAAPDRVVEAAPEMAALERALTGAAGAQSAPSSTLASPVPPAPDLTGARSILSAVHLASYRQREHAAPGWIELQGTAGGALGGLQPRLAEADLGEAGVYLRLKAGPIDSPDAARATCARLEAAGVWCAVSDFSGEPL